MIRAILISVLVSSVAIAADEQTSPTTQPSTQPAQMPADRLLDQMLRSSGPAARPLQPIANPPVIDQSSGAAVAPNAPQVALIREGDYIRDRTGRLQKSGDGQLYEFIFDADARAMQDPPVLILPNLKLMAMENAVASSTADLRFRITGPVTEYKGRNYVLLEKVFFITESKQQF